VHWASGIPHPLIFGAEEFTHDSGAIRAAGTRTCILTSLPATNAKRLRKGAEATKQSILSLCCGMDCFLCVATWIASLTLAMTVVQANGLFEI
jgi:hypothetical protein